MLVRVQHLPTLGTHTCYQNVQEPVMIVTRQEIPIDVPIHESDPLT